MMLQHATARDMESLTTLDAKAKTSHRRRKGKQALVQILIRC